MLATDKGALICDLAETYQVYDYRALPVRLLATLASGLREDSRIKLKMAGMRAPRETYLLASAVDALNLLVWAKTKDGEKGRNRPKSILRAIADPPKPEEKPLQFQSPDQFKAAWQRLTGKGSEQPWQQN